MFNEYENDNLQNNAQAEPAATQETYPDADNAAGAYEDIASGSAVHDDFSAAEEPVEPQQPTGAQPFEPQAKEPEHVYAEPVNNGYTQPGAAPGYQPGQSYGAYGGAQYGTQQNIPPYGSAYNANPYSAGASQTYTQNPYGGYTPPRQPAQDTPKKSRKGLRVLLTVVAVLVVAGLGIGVGAIIGSRGKSESPAILPGGDSSAATAIAGAPEMETKASPASDAKAAAGSAMTPTQIAAKVKASSVGILVYSRNATGLSGEGSGVVWKEDASGTYTYIITCAHVVSGSNLSYTVQTSDSETYDAELVGADSKTDLAVLRVKTNKMTPAEFGDSSALQVGDPVYAIGNPGGTEFFGSFTSGIVSAIDRSLKSTSTTVCIQHTAAINPGNSGGALVNQYGQVIGINSQKIVNTEYEGMGFAIPIKSAQKIINNLATYGYVKDRPKLGITYTEAVNYQQYSMIIKIKGLPSGALIITDINDDSSLKNTQAQQYDMIIKVNGEDMNKPEVLLDKIENGKVGDKLTLTLCRVDNNYQTREFDVTVTLVEESKESEKPETTTQQYINPYDFFNGDFFDGLF